MKVRKITREKDGAQFVVTFDENDTVDTITRDGKVVSAAHRDARVILNSADTLAAGVAPRGFVYTRAVP